MNLFDLRLATAGCQYGSRVRLVTLEILIISLKMIVTKVVFVSCLCVILKP